MRKFVRVFAVSLTMVFSASTRADGTWITNIASIDAWPGTNTVHYVWTTTGIGSGCPGGALVMNGSGDGGKGIFALLLMAKISASQVSLTIDGTGGNGCNILEARIL